MFTELVYGTISRKLLLEYYLTPFVKKPQKVDNWVKNLLILSLYQLLYLDKVPDHAVINEAVEIGKRRGNPGIGKFVNGVCGRSNEMEHLVWPQLAIQLIV